jgi:NAD(P)-dependent dehydrogenase (short-subunit alcohol dehydrogenase family)
MSEKPLQGTVAVVAGATRGAGRGIAVSLGEAGATVYCTGRSTRAHGATPGRPETIEETAELVTARGGKGIPVRVDHTVEAEVKALFDRVREEQSGRLDVLVNDIWGGDPLTNWQQPFWQHSLADGLHIQELAVKTHMITSYYGAPLMLKQGRGLIIEITDGVDYNYRGNLYYSLAKVSTIHLAQAMAADLKPHGVTALALTPGFLRSEAMLDHFGVTEANWLDGAKRDPHFAASETPCYIGRVVAALAAERNIAARAGQVLMSGDVAQEYGLTDIDGRQPNWRTYYAGVLASK